MLDPSRIPNIEADLAQRRIPVAELCRRAGISETTWNRWKNKRFMPSFGAGRKVLEALDEVLEEHRTLCGKAQPRTSESAET